MELTIENKALRNAGKQLAEGAVETLSKWLVIWILVMVALSLIGDWIGVIGRDATDSASHRSGMALKIDYGTGCQYLKAGDALTPRLDANGQPMCGVVTKD